MWAGEEEEQGCGETETPSVMSDGSAVLCFWLIVTFHELTQNDQILPPSQKRFCIVAFVLFLVVVGIEPGPCAH